MIKLKDIFNTDRPLVGMVHLAPLLGLRDAPSISQNIDNAVYDAQILEKAGFDALIIENNYDLPHDIFVKPNVISSFTQIAQKVKNVINLPVGICVLWNDFYSALSIAKLIGARFIRVAVFVDRVETDYGVVSGNPPKVLGFRKKIGAEGIAIFTDIQVKHSKLLNVRPISKAATEAKQKGADGLIVTGNWTGDAPKLDDLENCRNAVGDLPILVGSGAGETNLHTLLEYADGIIVGTSIKEGDSVSKEQNRNLKSFEQRLSLAKAKNFKQKFMGALASNH